MLQTFKVKDATQQGSPTFELMEKTAAILLRNGDIVFHIAS